MTLGGYAHDQLHTGCRLCTQPDSALEPHPTSTTRIPSPIPSALPGPLRNYTLPPNPLEPWGLCPRSTSLPSAIPYRAQFRARTQSDFRTSDSNSVRALKPDSESLSGADSAFPLGTARLRILTCLYQRLTLISVSSSPVLAPIMAPVI